ncbi:hypothetical protein, partial [Mucilaginibacter flavus]|uniref:hypothetical protein n=1 Tax=Mucilaginibacter flavus TaxID=931504 RepID=UPI0025B37201
CTPNGRILTNEGFAYRSFLRLFGSSRQQRFEQLNEHEKGEAMLSATYLNSRIAPGYKVNLYSLDDFFVEVFYSDLFNEIFQLKAFKSSDLPQVYLREIKLGIS